MEQMNNNDIEHEASNRIGNEGETAEIEPSTEFGNDAEIIKQDEIKEISETEKTENSWKIPRYLFKAILWGFPKSVKVNDKTKKTINWDYKVTENEINKRTLGKAIIKLCSNEGSENTEAQQYLRKLLQGCIDEIQQRQDIDWTNVTLEISGHNGEMCQIVAGEGHCRLYVLHDQSNKIQIIKKD